MNNATTATKNTPDHATNIPQIQMLDAAGFDAVVALVVRSYSTDGIEADADRFAGASCTGRLRPLFAEAKAELDALADAKDFAEMPARIDAVAKQVDAITEVTGTKDSIEREAFMYWLSQILDLANDAADAA